MKVMILVVGCLAQFKNYDEPHKSGGPHCAMVSLVLAEFYKTFPKCLVISLGLVSSPWFYLEPLLQQPRPSWLDQTKLILLLPSLWT
jgi:hypothetical protein